MNSRISSLRAEYFKNPLGIDARSPRLSWQLQSTGRNVRQSAYHIQVAHTEADLLAGRNLTWDTGEVMSDASIQVSYGGPPLESRARYWWRVRIRAARADCSWSDAAWWEMGLLDSGDWSARWLSPAREANRTLETAAGSQNPLLRREFQLRDRIVRARLYVTCHGLYQIRLNGAEVTDQVLTPGWTSYSRRLQYQTYDVADKLRPGTNALAAVLGEGWFLGTLGLGAARAHYGQRVALLLQLEVTYEDGRTERIESDTRWKTSTGPILFSGLYDGEIYDARLEQMGWSEPGYDDGNWRDVEEIYASKEVLIAPRSPPMRRIEERTPVSIFETPIGETVVDMGQNMVGWVRLRVRGARGTTVTLRHAEVLDAAGNFYTANLRAAKQTISYTLKGEREETFEPHFTFQGFRYIAVSGYPGELLPQSLTGIVVHSDLERTGEFSTSSPLVNQLHHNIMWGQKGNFVDVPTDCPQRDERLGWTGDAQVFVPTAAYNMDVAGFFTKWLADLAVDQYETGEVPYVIPDVLTTSIQTALDRRAGGEPGWGDAAVIVPWNLYLAYGDTRILEDQFASMVSWVEYVARCAGEGLIWQGDFLFGDWLDFFAAHPNVGAGVTGFSGVTSKELIATAYFARSADILLQAAGVLDKRGAAARYADLTEKIRTAFQREFVTADGTVGQGTQTAYVLALDFDLLAIERRASAAAKLAEDVRTRGHLTTGFLGTPRLLNVLTRFGFPELAYGLLNREEFPSWLFSVKHGATTIWERWDGIKSDGSFQDASMNSFNHYAYGAVGEWLYRVMGGIDVDPQTPGYKHIRIQPEPGGGFSFVRAIHESPYGRICSHWRLVDDAFELRVQIPPNTAATVRLPHARLSEVTESGADLADAEGVLKAIQEEFAAVLNVGSGDYVFRYRLEEPTI